MGVLVEIAGPGEIWTWGVLLASTISEPEWQIEVTEVPRHEAFGYRDVVAVLAGASVAESPRPFVRVVATGRFQRSLRVTHARPGRPADDGWLDELERAGWATRDDDRGAVWLAAPIGVDTLAVLAARAWVVGVA